MMHLFVWGKDKKCRGHIENGGKDIHFQSITSKWKDFWIFLVTELLPRRNGCQILHQTWVLDVLVCMIGRTRPPNFFFRYRPVSTARLAVTTRTLEAWGLPA